MSFIYIEFLILLALRQVKLKKKQFRHDVFCDGQQVLLTDHC